MVINYCFVPTCANNSYITPNKKFLSVPMDTNIRKSWALAVGLPAERISKSGKLRCCEDHFDLEHDAENWIQFTMIGSRLLLKKNVIPHLNLAVKKVINTQSQISPSSKKRKEDNIKKFMANKKQLRIVEHEPSTTNCYIGPTKHTDDSQNVWSSSGDFQVNRKTLSASAGVQVNLRRSVGVNTYIEKCDKAVQCNIINYN